MSIKLDKSGLLVFFILHVKSVWNAINKEGSPFYYWEKMIRESFEIAYGLMAERNFGLICKGFSFLERGRSNSSLSKTRLTKVLFE